MIGTVAATAGRPITISGYAQDFGEAVACLQFSCDGGRTWTTHTTDGADPNRNVNWSFTFTPPEAGCYELLIRAACTDGRHTPKPALVHIEANPA